MGYLGWKAKVATSCRNAFMTNIVLARGSSAAPEKRSVFRSGGFFRFNISVDFPATQLFLYAKDEKLRRSLFIFRSSETVVNIIEQFYSYLRIKKTILEDRFFIGNYAPKLFTFFAKRDF